VIPREQVPHSELPGDACPALRAVDCYRLYIYLLLCIWTYWGHRVVQCTKL